jgi:hypothetical protein
MAKRLNSSLAARAPMKDGVVTRSGVDGHELDDYQRAIASDFGRATPSQEDQESFGIHFENARILSEKLEKYRVSTDRKEKRLLKKEINQLDNSIAPSARCAAFETKNQIREGLFEYFKQYGEIVSKAHVVEWLDLNGYTVVRRAKRPGAVLSERRTYELISEICWRQDKPGRKPG